MQCRGHFVKFRPLKWSLNKEVIVPQTAAKTSVITSCAQVTYIFSFTLYSHAMYGCVTYEGVLADKNKQRIAVVGVSRTITTIHNPDTAAGLHADWIAVVLETQTHVKHTISLPALCWSWGVTGLVHMGVVVAWKGIITKRNCLVKGKARSPSPFVCLSQGR